MPGAFWPARSSVPLRLTGDWPAVFKYSESELLPVRSAAFSIVANLSGPFW